jgi:hypothetical protein
MKDDLHIREKFTPPPENKPPPQPEKKARSKANGPQPQPPPHPGMGANTSAESDYPKPNFRKLADFISEFRPISYAVAGLMREGSLYTITGRTGEGKTALLIIMALAIATGEGERLIGRKVKKGRVAFATAENPDDLRTRLMVACFVLNIDPAIIGDNIIVSDNRIRPEEIIDWIKETGGSFTFIIVDTWQAFFDGRDPNNNAEAVSFTRRFRPLAATSGLPVVLVAAHPPKQASDDNLLPYGGGSTLNEVDGNYTFALDDSGLYRFSWLGKIRGQSFEPLYFRIDRQLDSPDVVTVDGERVQMPVMFPVDEEAVEARLETFANRDIDFLKAMAAEPNGSTRKWAAALKWTKRAVTTTLDHLKRDKLVEMRARRWRLTKIGETMVKEAQKANSTERDSVGTANAPQNGTVSGTAASF